MLESTKNLQERASLAVEMATRLGADAVGASTSSNRSTQTTVRNGEVEKMQESNSRSLALKLYVDGRYFEHRTNDLRPKQLEDFVKEAVALTRAVEPDPYRALPDPKLFEGRTQTDLQMFDASIASISAEHRIEQCMALDAKIAGGSDVISASSSMSDGTYAAAGASSNGFVGSLSGTFMGMYGNITLQGEGDKRPEGGMGMSVRHRKDMLDVDWIGAEAQRLARARLGTKKGPSVKTTMVVDRLSAARLLYMLISPAFGNAVHQGRSMWKDKLGKSVLSKTLQLTDEPHIVRGVGSRPFDDEGLSTRKREIIRDGALQAYFLNTYYARKLKTAPTSGGLTNLVVEPGRGDLASIARDVGKGVYVTSWLGGNSDSTSGEFSLGLRGHMIENGEIGAPVGEMNVTGNVIELFRRLSRVGGDPWIHSSARCPTLVFDDVSFSGQDA